MWKVRNFLCRRCWGCRHLFTTAAKAWAIFTGAIDRDYLVLWNITVSRNALKYNISKTLNKIFAGRRPHGDLTSHFLYGSLMKRIYSVAVKILSFIRWKILSLPARLDPYIWSCLAVINCESPLNAITYWSSRSDRVFLIKIHPFINICQTIEN